MGGIQHRLIASLALVGVAVVGIVGCGGSSASRAKETSEIRRSCRPVEGRDTDLWSERVRADLALAVRVFEGRLAPAEAERITVAFSDLAGEWRRTVDALCPEYAQRRSLSAEQYEQGLACLEQIVVDGKSLVRAIGAGELERVSELDGLRTRVAQCSPTDI